MIKLIVFDLDGVIVASKPAYALAYQRMLARNGVKATLREINPFLGKKTDTVVNELFEAFGVEYTDDKIRANADSLDTEVVRVLRSVKIKAIATKRELMRCQKIAPLCLISGSNSKVVSVVLKIFNLRDAFNIIIAADDTPNLKSQNIEHLLNLYCISPEEAVYVGDMPSDVNIARKAGVKSVILYTRDSWVWGKRAELTGCDQIVGCYDELWQWLKSQL